MALCCPTNLSNGFLLLCPLAAPPPPAAQLPIALWCSAVIIIFGVSFQELSDLQGPLASLNVAAHVMYRVARLRAQLSLLAFELNTTVTETYRAEALTELGLLRREYETLLYGGRVLTLVSGGGNSHLLARPRGCDTYASMPCI
jgi:hypothetical protein